MKIRLTKSIGGYHTIGPVMLLGMLAYSMVGCNRNPPVDAPFKFLPSKQGYLVVWVKPGAGPDAFSRWKTDVETRLGQPLTVEKKCRECDNELMLVSGSAAQTYITGQTASGGNGSPGKTGASGEDGDIIFSVNYPIEFTDSVSTKDSIPISNPVKKKPTRDAITVAIFDTGIDPDPKFSGLFYNSSLTSCFGTNANNGFNFTSPDNVYTDNHPSKHGSIAAGFVADQVYKYGENSVSLLPVKTHNAAGQSDLFSILCGMSYAVNRGAKIINASWGFYSPRYLAPSLVLDSSAYLLKKYVEYYLLPRNILLVAAAGNRDDRNEDVVYRPLDRSLQRNLENVSFYPASLARELRNVIAVTTVDQFNSVSPLQNYSPNVVDLGVYADRARDFAFENPIRPGLPVIGSSFATPIVTGKLCALYYRIKSSLATGVYTKDELMTLLGPDIVFQKDMLRDTIVHGNVMLK